MPDDLVSVYDAANVSEATLLADRLRQAGIKVFIDNTDSPFDGLTAGDQTNPVRVLPSDAERARPIVKEWLGESSTGSDEEE